MRKIIYLLLLVAAIGAFAEQRVDIMGGDGESIMQALWFVFQVWASICGVSLVLYFALVLAQPQYPD